MAGSGEGDQVAAPRKGVVAAVREVTRWSLAHIEAVATLVTAFGTIVLAIVTYSQAHITRRQLDEMVAEQRPWLFAEPVVDARAHVTIGPSGLNIPLSFKLSNVGHTPASNVLVSTASAITTDDQVDLERRGCKRTMSAVRMGAITVFPNQTTAPVVDEAGIEPEKVRKALAEQPFALPTVLICVTYEGFGGQRFTTPLPLTVTVNASGVGLMLGDLPQPDQRSEYTFSVREASYNGMRPE